MQFLPLFFLASVQLWVSNAQAVISSCQIMNITPDNINGFAQCGTGSLTAGCVCCGGPHGNVACLSPIETCTVNVYGYYCVTSPGYTDQSCASQGLTTCGTTCMPVGASCCPNGIQNCPAGSSCDSQNLCFQTSPLPTPTIELTTSLPTTEGAQVTVSDSQHLEPTTSLPTTKGDQVTTSNSKSPAGTTAAQTTTTGTVAGSLTGPSIPTHSASTILFPNRFILFLWAAVMFLALAIF